MLELLNVKVKIGGASILNGISFSVAKGEIVGLIGPNGSGKTTLFNAISGFVPIDSGSVVFKGEAVTELSPDTRAQRGLARVFQNSGVFHEMTLLENVLLALEGKRSMLSKLIPNGKLESELMGKANGFLAEVKLQGLANEKASSLSGGQKRLLEIVRALAFEADLFLLDEPSAGVSPKMKDEVGDQIRNLKVKGKTAIVIEHDMNFISGFCDRILVINQGEVALSGTPSEVRRSELLREIYFGKETVDE